MYGEFECEIGNLKLFPKSPSILETFPSETSIMITQKTILCLKGNGCNCSWNSFVANKFSSSHGLFSNKDTAKDIEKERKESNINAITGVKAQTVSLNTEDEVKWVLEILKYSITIPVMTYIDVIKHSIHIYCSWLLKSACPDDFEDSTTPQCIKENPNDFIGGFLSSLGGFFKNFVVEYSNYCNSMGFQVNSVVQLSVESKPELGNVVKELSLVIELILSTVEQVASQSAILTECSWNSLLYFSLYVSNALLVYPSEPSQITYGLAERISWTLFKIWLQACDKCFPRSSLWKTFTKLAQTWRHQEAFIIQWNKIMASFTYRLMDLINHNFPKMPEIDIDTDNLIPSQLTDSTIKDCWYRLLHLIGNPCEMCHQKYLLCPDLIEPKRKLNYSLAHTNAISNQYLIFHRAMHGLSNIIDAFLGLDRPFSGFSLNIPLSNFNANFNIKTTEQSSPETKRIFKFTNRPLKTGVSVVNRNHLGYSVDNTQSTTNTTTAISPTNSQQQELNIDSMPAPHPQRPLTNALLKLFGNWLFEAAMIGVKQNLDNVAISARAAKIEPSKFNAGRSEAFGSLCRIFSYGRRDKLQLDYITKFYIALYYGLDIEPTTASSLVLSSILFNTTEILRMDLTGIHILVPKIYRAVHFVLSNDMEKPDLISRVQLRRASINHLLSLISLPTYMMSVDIKSLLPLISTEKRESYFDIRRSMSQLLSENIRNETDQRNLNLLISCLVAFLETVSRDDEPESDRRAMSKESTPTDRVVHVSECFNHALGLLSINLVHKWKDDLVILQFALEALTDMSKLKFKSVDKNICIRSVRFLCEFIENQMNRRSKEHSRLLHNIIIAAYYCLALWLVHHPYLLDDRECLVEVLEIAELGISGSKSKIIESDAHAPGVLKADKQASPTSKRVQVAAEYLVHCIMSEVGGSYLAGPHTTGSLISEKSLRITNTPSELYSQFRYFALDNDIILALLEFPPTHLTNNCSSSLDPQPSILVILRTSFARHVWIMRSRQLANLMTPPITSARVSPNQSSATSNLMSNLFTGRPYNTSIYKELNSHSTTTDQDLIITNESDEENCPDIEPNYFPDVINRPQMLRVEFSIPKLDTLMSDEDLVCIQAAILDNTKLHNSIRDNCYKFRTQRTEVDYLCKQPTPVTEIQTARLILYQLGYLSINSFIANGVNLDKSDNGNYADSTFTGNINGDFMALPRRQLSNQRRRASDNVTDTIATTSAFNVAATAALSVGLGNSSSALISNSNSAGLTAVAPTASTPNGPNASSTIIGSGTSSINNQLENSTSPSSTSVTFQFQSNNNNNNNTNNNNNNNSHIQKSINNIVMLDSSTSSFFTALDQLDQLSSRSCDTCYIYYVRQSQTKPCEILTNFNDWPNFSSDFLSLLLTLGWLVDVQSHHGWTGTSSSGIGQSTRSTRPQQPPPLPTNQQQLREIYRLVHGPIPDGTQTLIYWADNLREVAFLMASSDNLAQTLPKPSSTIDQSDHSSSSTAVTPTTGPTSLNQQRNVPATGGNLPVIIQNHCGSAVSLVWLEDWNDIEKINIPELIGATTERCGVVVCPTSQGLFRIRMYRPPLSNQRHYSAGPLATGMLLDHKSLGPLIRQTVININRRIRLDSENLFAPHLPRYQRLQQIISEHKLQLANQINCNSQSAQHILPVGGSQLNNPTNCLHNMQLANSNSTVSTNYYLMPDLLTSLLHPPISGTEPRF